MTRMTIVALSLWMGLSPYAHAQESRNAVDIDPAHHRVVFENEHVRIIDALAPPGATSPMHTHLPGVVVSLARARTKLRTPDGSTGYGDLRPGTVSWTDGVEHAWEVVAGTAHAIGIVVKSAAAGDAVAAIALPDTDAVTVDPTHHVVLFENEHVRVFRAQASPGATSPPHTHPPLALISLGTARLDIRGDDDSRLLLDFLPGQVLWVDGTRHSWEVLAGHAHVIAVEIKAARE